MVTIQVDWRSLRIYINDLIHVFIVRDNFSGLQTWNDGYRYVIEFILSDGKLVVEYDDKRLWEEVLSKIGPHL